MPAVDAPAREAVRRAWSTATWLGAQPPARGIVRHNVQRPFIEQLAEVVTSPVRTMRVHAPFYDRDLSGLVTLLKGVVAERVEVLTTRTTSVDGSTLKATLDELRVPTAYQTLGLRDPSETGTYLHAKWIHLLCDDKEVLLSGSANLSSPGRVPSTGSTSRSSSNHWRNPPRSLSPTRSLTVMDPCPTSRSSCGPRLRRGH